MTMQSIWQKHEQHGRLIRQSNLPDTVFAFAKQRKEPLTDAAAPPKRCRQVRPGNRCLRRGPRLGVRQYRERRAHYDVTTAKYDKKPNMVAISPGDVAAAAHQAHLAHGHTLHAIDDADEVENEHLVAHAGK
ncbi:MAG: hypothetical protein JOZ49_08535 [Mycolicibacterium sp.]|nr:hypothetical protein [Mycolicibacterium sp.]